MTEIEAQLCSHVLNSMTVGSGDLWTELILQCSWWAHWPRWDSWSRVWDKTRKCEISISVSPQLHLEEKEERGKGRPSAGWNLNTMLASILCTLWPHIQRQGLSYLKPEMCYKTLQCSNTPTLKSPCHSWNDYLSLTSDFPLDKELVFNLTWPFSPSNAYLYL